MNRRNFIKSSALAAASLSVAPYANANPQEKTEQPKSDKLIDSAPVLQNYAETSIGIAFSVTDLANGFVIIGEKPDLSDGKKVMCGGYRLTDISNEVIQVRICNLKPATKYYYKIGADRIHYGGGYDMKVLCTEINDTVYTFTTAGKKANSHFCVINDTHARWTPFGLAIDKIAEINPSCVIWNGDACNAEETIAAQKRIFIKPEITHHDYASQIPYLFCAGNHDMRGFANRHLEQVWMYRQPEERLSRDWDLGRNFAVRMGDVALIGLDTAEDKQDSNPAFAGLFNSTAYREAQVDWLRDVLKRKEIASAPFLVAFCHIPLFDDDPKHNPGDVQPDDTHPDYTHNYAIWQRTCANLWGPLLHKAKCQLVITAHQHSVNYHAPQDGRCWAQIVGGGPEMNSKSSTRFPTVIEGQVVNKELIVKIHNLRHGNVYNSYTFKAR